MMKRARKRIDYSKSFDKQLRKAPFKIKIAFRTRLKLFLQDLFSSQLLNHALVGKYLGFRSINITGDWRVVYKEEKNVIIFLLLGTHSQLYKY